MFPPFEKVGDTHVPRVLHKIAPMHDTCISNVHVHHNNWQKYQVFEAHLMANAQGVVSILQ